MPHNQSYVREYLLVRQLMYGSLLLMLLLLLLLLLLLYLLLLLLLYLLLLLHLRRHTGAHHLVHCGDLVGDQVLLGCLHRPIVLIQDLIHCGHRLVHCRSAIGGHYTLSELTRSRRFCQIFDNAASAK